MAELLPSDFDLTQLEHSERRVCTSFLDGLDDTWTVVPHVPVVDEGKDAEIDLLLVSPTRGVIAVEVKGGAITIDGGRWRQNGRLLHTSPTQQVVQAKHCLVRRMKQIGVDMHDLYISHAVALPDVGAVPADGLGPDAPAGIVFAKPQLAMPVDAVDGIARVHDPIPRERLARFLKALRPDIVLGGGEGELMVVAARHLDDVTRTNLANARTLDRNQRVLVTGGAGTGKTWLATDWARRAVARGERTLVVCFNRPIAEHLQRALADTPAMVGTYHDVAVRLLEPFGFQVGANPSPEYWEHIPTEALTFHAERIGTPIDTVVVDEGQDMRAAWFASLERLLDPGGPCRLLVTADPAQAIYVTPWSAPPRMVEMELVHNLRNARAIAELVQSLGGPEPLPHAPVQIPVVHLHAGGIKEVRKRVRDTVAALTDEHGVPFSQIAVLTTRTQTRDLLLEDPPEGCPLARWEQRSEDTVMCETVHRTKGLERTAVILVDVMDEPDPTLRYIGASRAVASLTLITRADLGAAAR